LANAIFEYLEIFQNRQCRHLASGMITPVEFEARHHTTTASRVKPADSTKPRAPHYSTTLRVVHGSYNIWRVTGIKSTVARFLPESVLRTYWGLRRRNYAYGLPTSATQIPDNDVWNADSWRCGDLRKFATRYSARDLDLPVGSYVSEIASIIAASGRPVNIVDFGGGNGSLFFALRKTRQLISSYHIYDDTDEAFDNAFVDIDEPTVSLRPIGEFFSEVDAQDDLQTDIIISNTTLQYCEDLSGFIFAVKRFNPRLIILTRFLATSPGTKSIVVPQHYPDGVTQCRFHEVQSMVDSFAPEYQLSRDDPIPSEDISSKVIRGFPLNLISRFSRIVILSRPH
jgi:putative methyltransferase (TIGR04325 family)